MTTYTPKSCFFFKGTFFGIIFITETTKTSLGQPLEHLGCQIGCIKKGELQHIWVFPKIVYPQIIHFNRGFHYKPPILGVPLFLETPISIYYKSWLYLMFQYISLLGFLLLRIQWKKLSSIPDIEGCYQFQGQENFVFVKCGFVDQTFSLVASLISYDISGNLRRVVHGSIKLLLPPKMSLVGRM